MMEISNEIYFKLPDSVEMFKSSKLQVSFIIIIVVVVIAFFGNILNKKNKKREKENSKLNNILICIRVPFIVRLIMGK